MVCKNKAETYEKMGESVNILLCYLLTLGFCYFQTSTNSVILSSPRIFFLLQIYGNSFQSRSKNSLGFQGVINQCFLSTCILLYYLV